MRGGKKKTPPQTYDMAKTNTVKQSLYVQKKDIIVRDVQPRNAY
jgi:hypothetical protein